MQAIGRIYITAILLDVFMISRIAEDPNTDIFCRYYI